MFCDKLENKIGSLGIFFDNEKFSVLEIFLDENSRVKDNFFFFDKIRKVFPIFNSFKIDYVPSFFFFSDGIVEELDISSIADFDYFLEKIKVFFGE